MTLIALIILICLGFILSEDKKSINWRTVILGLLGQAILVWFVIKVPIGQKILEIIANFFNGVFQLGMEGVNFVFGGISTTGFVFLINSLALIVFTSTLIAVLYFFKVIPFLVKYLGGIITKVLGTSSIEAMVCVSNMMLGGSEAVLVVKDYLPTITKSEFFVCMSSGFASASVGILAGYAAMGFDLKYMLIAVFTVPFSCLMVSKMLVPQTEAVDSSKDVIITKSNYNNIFEAISVGSSTGMQVAFAVGAILIGFLGIIAVVNCILNWFGVSLSEILGVVFMPFGWLLKIPHNEIIIFGSILGDKIGANEFVAFNSMAQAVQAGALSERTISILTTACTNFANFSVIGIVGSALITLAPNRKEEISKYGVKALLVGTIATMITATLVAMMI